MQGTADGHHHVAHPVLPHPDGLFEHATAFDTALDLFHAHPSPSDRPVVRFLGWRQRLPARLLRGLDDLHSRQRACVQAGVLQQLAPSRKRRRCRVGEARVVDAARMGLTQEQDAQRGIDQQKVFQPLPLFLAALARLLCSCVLGAWDGALGAVMTKRGGAMGAAAGTSAAGDASSGTGAPATSSCVRRASIGRQGASPM